MSFDATREEIWGPSHGGKTPRTTPGPVVITKPVDQSSVKLFERTMLGSLFGKVTISCCESDDTVRSSGTLRKNVVYYQIVLTRAHLIRYRTHNTKTDQTPTDEIALDYQKIDLLYNKSDGRGNFSGKWNLQTNSCR